VCETTEAKGQKGRMKGRRMGIKKRKKKKGEEIN
jgi:hypothetical protein